MARTSKRIAHIDAKKMHSRDKTVREIAASGLRLRQKSRRGKRSTKRSSGR